MSTTPTYRRNDDHNSRNRELWEETQRIGAPGYEAYQRTIKRMPSPLEKLIEQKVLEIRKHIAELDDYHTQKDWADGPMKGDIYFDGIEMEQRFRTALHSIAEETIKAVRPEKLECRTSVEDDMHWNEAVAELDHRAIAFLSPSDKHE